MTVFSKKDGLLLAMTVTFVFWSGEMKICERDKHNKLKCRVTAGLFRGNPETGEIEEFVRFEDEYRDKVLNEAVWLLIKERLR